MSTPFVGEIRLFGFPRIPTGWLACDGSLQSISGYEVLYTLLGTTYGGDGQNTFGLPDLRGRVPLHQGTGNGLSPRPLGQSVGTESVDLTIVQLPLHTHIAYATTNQANATSPSSSVAPGTVASTDTMYSSNLTGARSFNLENSAVTYTGGSQPHDNTMPTLTASYCIAFEGLFPSQS
ncbi:phage tail protein [Dyella sp. M7H15-1]|uniref:phage tail protein n=1 Tax=Dyella sp. M7H15-1 TaxID=2501295 RepID=UPI001004D7A7|nr:tail fiber protein [Dyella sp. M7H15-1]QAU24851.1 phage tail protein [Dyella sp. M7H15-1]